MMKYSPIKCEYLRVTNKSLPLTAQYFINSVKIQQVPHAKYLGVYIEKHYHAIITLNMFVIKQMLFVHFYSVT